MAQYVEPADEQLGLFAEAETAAGKLKQKKGTGRPLGARNKRTERTVAFLMAQHRDPRAVLLEIAEANVNDLAGLLGCTVHEALQEKRLAAIGVLPYVAQKQPIGIDVRSHRIVHLNIIEGDPGAGSTDGIGLTARVIQMSNAIDIDADGEAAAETPATVLEAGESA